MYVELTPSVHRVLPLLVQIYFSNGYNLAVQIKLAQPKGFKNPVEHLRMELFR